MSTFKRILSFMLTLVMVLGMFPLNVTATQQDVKADAGEVSLEGSNSLGTLLTEEIQAQQEASAISGEEYDAGFSVTDLQFSGATATVTYNALEEATLVVAVYTEDGMTLLNSAYTQVIPEQTQTTVTLNGEMPRYFAASAYLLNTYDMAPLCPAYDTPIYTQSMQELLDSTVEDYPEDRVLNLDDDNTTNFAVYAEGTVVIEEQSGVNTVISANDETMTYVIGNANEQFTALQTGDVVVYPYGEDQCIVAKVANISVSDDTVTISGGELKIEDVFSHVKIQGGSNGEAIVDESTVDEGVSYVDAPQTFSYEAGDILSIHKDVEISWNLQQGNHVTSVGGFLGIDVTASFEYYSVEEQRHLELRTDTDLFVSLEASGTVNMEKELGTWLVPIVQGGLVRLVMRPKFVAKLSAKIEIQGSLRVTNGYTYDTDIGVQPIRSTPTFHTEIIGIEGEFSIGFDLNPRVNVGYGLFVVSSNLPVMIVISAKLGVDTLEDTDVRHSCKNCLDIDVDLKFEWEFMFLSVFHKFVQNVKLPEVSWHLGDAYWSGDHEEFGWGTCPYKSFLTTFQVKNHSGSVVPFAELTVLDMSDGTRMANQNGVCSYYLLPGTYSVQVVSGEISHNVTVVVEAPQKVTITLPDENQPEETEPAGPAVPGGIIDDMEPVPETDHGVLLYSGVFDNWYETHTCTWQYYSNGALYVYGVGRIQNAPWYEIGMPIKHLIIGNGITMITDYEYYPYLETLSIPITMEVNYSNLYHWRDEYAPRLRKVVLPEGITSIYRSAFSNYSALEEINIPRSVTYIGPGPFYGCTSLKELYIPGPLSRTEGEYGGILGESGVKTVTLGEGITEVRDKLFYGSDNLEQVNLPSTLKVIGEMSFYDCPNLKQIEIPEGVTRIETGAFRASGLTEIDLPDTLIQIDDSAFNQCTSLESIVIPASVETIGTGAFFNCFNLKQISFAERQGKPIDIGDYLLQESQLDTIDFPEGARLGSDLFPGCSIETVIFRGPPVSLYGDAWGNHDEWALFASVRGETTAYYPAQYSAEYAGNEQSSPDAVLWTRQIMRKMSGQGNACLHVTWIPFTYDENGNMVPDESKTFRPWIDPVETAETEGTQTETVPPETEPAVTETVPPETEPAVTETVPPETEPAVTETIPVETNPVETAPAETIPQVTEQAETVPEEVIPTEADAQDATAFTTVAIPTPAGANTFRVGSSRGEAVRATSSQAESGTPAGTGSKTRAIYSGDYFSQVTENRKVKTASFSGLVPGEEYLLLALATLDTDDPLHIDNLIHIDQGIASPTGALNFDYVERQDYSVSYVMISGPSNRHLQDAIITFPVVYASDGEQVIQPTVEYDGKILTEGKDYVLSGKVFFSTAGEYTCYIRGIYEYAGTVQCTYKVLSCNHTEVIDQGVEVTCTESGLTEGKHCSACDEVLIEQEVIPATGHSFQQQDDKIICSACGEELKLSVAQDYVLLKTGQTLALEISPAELADKIEWTVEGDEGVVTTSANVLTAVSEGTVYVTATIKAGELKSSVLFRVDVSAHENIPGIQLSTQKLTVELYRTKYTGLDILLKLPQNYGRARVGTNVPEEDMGIAIEKAYFKNQAIRNLFEIRVLDDRSVSIIPTDTAVKNARANPKSVAGKYTDKIIVEIGGRKFESENLTLTVKKTLPKIKATVKTFNSFYPNQEKKMTITGGTVQRVYANEAKTTALPNWLTLSEDGTLTLIENAPAKSLSGKVYILVDTAEWRIPAALTVTVKNTYKVPAIKLAAASVKVKKLDASGIPLKLACAVKTDKLENLMLKGITAPTGYSIENFNSSDGTFTLTADNGFKAGKIKLTVAYGNTTKKLTLTVKLEEVKLKLGTTKVRLNKNLNESASVALTCITRGYELTAPVLSYDSTKLDVRFENGMLNVSLKDDAAYGKTYPVTVRAYQGAPAVKLNVAVLKKTAVVKSTIKATGTLDVIRQGTFITVKPTYTNVRNVDVQNKAVLNIYSSRDKYKTAIAEVKAENGVFVIDNSIISDHTVKYKAQLETKIYEDRPPVKSAMISLKVKMGTAKVTAKADNATMFANDVNDRVVVTFTAASAKLNGIEKVEIKTAAQAAMFEIIDNGDGTYSIAFKDGVVPASITKQLKKKSRYAVTLTLNIFIEGNPTTKANTTANVKLTIVR